MPVVDPSSNRTAAADEDGADHIGSDTPRSGVATPQPDLHDKRLPGIMSYFSQVRQDPPATDTSTCASCVPVPLVPVGSDAGSTSSSSSLDQQPDLPAQRHSPTSSEKQQPSLCQKSLCCARSVSDCHLPMPLEKLGLASSHVLPSSMASHPYPTPPSSQPSYSESSSCKGANFEDGEAAKTASHGRTSIHEIRQRISSPAPAVSTQQDSVGAPSELVSPPATSQTPPSSSSSSSSPSKTIPKLPQTSAPSKWFSLEGLKELTRGVIFKSGPPTPTRALSAAHSSQSDGRDTPSRTSNDGAETASGTQTPRTAGVQPPAQKGKLTIKIVEARGLRKCRDPYVVAVFQRSELISGGPRAIEEEETLSATPSGLGGIPIQRQGSDSGRPPMAIPMRSRQSSNTSIHDYNTFRNRTMRAPSSNPKWDAEAVLFAYSPLLSNVLTS
ncbi:hypothetical protein VCV18_005680 [Metarhizium anisopliae]